MRTLGVLLTALLLAGCSSPAPADVGEIEATITKQMQRQLDGQRPNVNCPDEIAWETGSDFHCLARVGDQTIRVTVTMENDQRDWTWATNS